MPARPCYDPTPPPEQPPHVWPEWPSPWDAWVELLFTGAAKTSLSSRAGRPVIRTPVCWQF